VPTVGGRIEIVTRDVLERRSEIHAAPWTGARELDEPYPARLVIGLILETQQIVHVRQ
jgi:hypothetical protein